MNATTQSRPKFLPLSLFSILGFALVLSTGCEDGDEAGSGESGGDELDGQMCMPSGLQPEHEALLNASLDAGVEVITKLPRHPGAVGPAGLP